MFSPDNSAPRSSPWPRRPSDSALSVAFVSSGSILCSRSMSDWNNVLTSSCT
ncbi:Uncharacterised protein [Mycobacterium tuberculosis]|nr:Uncharacterised protein [Mycobacterium tuberculosis]